MSFWYKDIGELPHPRPALDGDASADVCIIGAGYTGLTRLPWVNRRVRRWEPEPMRWLGVRGM